MRDRRTVLVASLAGMLAASLGACSVPAGEFAGGDALADAPGPAATPPELVFERGVTTEPCPEGPNPDNGCIHLGAIVDRSGPFAEVGTAGLAGAEAFWDAVNEEGGVFGSTRHGRSAYFDVDLASHVADSASDAEAHLDALGSMREDVLALALSQGTAPNVEALRVYKQHDVVTVPLSWWSGWPFEPIVADTGVPDCLQAMAGLDYLHELLGEGGAIDHVVVVHTPDRYGEDVAAGVAHWAEVHRLAYVPSIHAVAVPAGGEVGGAVELIREVAPEVVVVATAPAELGALAAATAEGGWDGYIVGASPSFAPSLLDDSAVMEALTQRFVRVDPYPPLEHEATAYEDMRRHLGGDAPRNHFWIAGWMNQYPLFEAIKDALAGGDISPAGLRHAVEEVTVVYEEGLRRRQYLGDVTHQTPRAAWIYTPDAHAPLGERLLGSGYVSETAQRFDLTRPCSED